MGFTRGMDFEVSFERCASDGVFDDAELELLEDKAGPFLDHGVDGHQLKQMLELKAAMDAEVRAARYRPQIRRGRSGDGDLAEWLLPDDVRDAAESAGWEITQCRDDEIDEIQFVSCEASRGPLSASIQVDRYPRVEDAEEIAKAPTGTAAVHQDGDTVLRASVLDGPAAIILRDGILAKGDKLSDLSLGPVQATIKGGGWQLETCDAQKSGATVSVSCVANQRGREALVDLVLDGDAGDPADEERILAAGTAVVLQADCSLTTTVSDSAPASELVEELLR